MRRSGAGAVLLGSLTVVGGAGATIVAVLVAVVAAVPLGGAATPTGSPAAVAPAVAGAGTSTPAVDGVPAVYMAAFDLAAARFGVSWGVLAGIYRVECDFGQSRLPGCLPGTENPLGAQGPGQFLPDTWRRGLPPDAIIPPGPPAPDGQGFATDGDGDGVADPWDPYDAVASTARMLAADGAADDISGAIFSYNHDPQYVAQVLALAGAYERDDADGAGVPPGSGAGRVATVVDFARAQLGDPYVWGGAGPDTWDCSGLVQAAFAHAGIVLTHDAAEQYAATAADAVPLGQLQPGDLVFYGTSPATIHHVGIAIDGTQMIDAPHTGTVVRVDPVAASDLFAATDPLQ